jgi:hypothetical protein
MKVEGWLFLGAGIFFAGTDVVYWYTSKEVTGTTALDQLEPVGWWFGFAFFPWHAPLIR